MGARQMYAVTPDKIKTESKSRDVYYNDMN